MGKLLAVAAPAVALLVVTCAACSSASSVRNTIRDDLSLEQQLFTAADRGNAKLVRALLERGANPNAVVKTMPMPDGDAWSDTSYIAAACAGGFSPEVFDLIVEAGGDMNTRRSKRHELPPPFQGCGNTFSSRGDESNSPGILLQSMLRHGYVLPSPQKILKYAVGFPGDPDSDSGRDVIRVLPADVAAAVTELGRANMAERKRQDDERSAQWIAEQKRRDEEAYAKASPEWRKVLDEHKRIIRAHAQGLPVTPSEAPAPPNDVGDMVCRKGRLQYQTCTNPAYAQSCVTTGVQGLMFGWVERFSDDRSRAQIRGGGVEASGTVRYPIHSPVTLEGVGAGKGDMFWDNTSNWYECHRIGTQ